MKRSEQAEWRTRYVIDQSHPIGGEMSEILLGLASRVRFSELVQHHSSTRVLALFSFVNGCGPGA